MDIIQFLGRFHVLVLHLPIGILMLAAVIELFTSIKSKSRNKLLNTIWLWGAVSAIGACILGWLLSQGEGYTPDAVFIHRTFGILTAIIAVGAFGYFTWIKTHHKVIIWGLSLGQLFLLFSTGHYGANMTHGETYLVDHAPNIVRTTLGFAKHKAPRPAITSLAQADVYLDVIQPMLDKRCVNCHNDTKQKGRLNLSTVAGLTKGGKSGKTIVPGDLAHSELYKRIAMEHHNKGFMPAEGKTPLTNEQTKTIAWWINVGAPVTGNVAQYPQNKQDKALLNTLLGLNTSEFDLPKLTPISMQQEQALVDTGFVFKRISQNHEYLDLDLSVKRQPLTEQGVQALLNIKQHILALNLRASQVTDDHLPQISTLPNLLRLRLEYNPVTSAGVDALASLPKLRYLNLYKSKVDNSVLDSLNRFEALQKVFIGETQITQAQVTEFAKHSNIQLQGVTPVTPLKSKKKD